MDKIDIVDRINFSQEQFGLEIKVSMKGYTSTIKYSYEDRCYYGKIENIDDLFLFEGEDVGEACYSFVEAVHNYQEMKGIIKRDKNRERRNETNE
jgi:predicted HicB family RNase H-like nuclease